VISDEVGRGETGTEAERANANTVDERTRGGRSDMACLRDTIPHSTAHPTSLSRAQWPGVKNGWVGKLGGEKEAEEVVGRPCGAGQDARGINGWFSPSSCLEGARPSVHSR